MNKVSVTEQGAAEYGWFGQLPNGWSVLPVRTALVEKNLKNDDCVRQAYLSLVSGVGVIPYEDKGDVGNKKSENLSGCKLVEVGDFVINSMNFLIGGFGRSGLQGVCSSVYVVATPNEQRYDPRFLMRLFQVGEFQRHVGRLGKGIMALRMAIGWDELKNQGLPTPSLEQQVRIANFLDEKTERIDALIAEKERLSELLNEQRQSWLSSELFEMLTDPKVRLKFCLETGLQYGATESGDKDVVGPRYIRITDIRADGTLSGDDAKFLTEEQAVPYMLDHNDVLFARSGATVGKSFIYSESMGPCAYAGYLIRAKLQPQKLLPRYLRLLTETHQYWAYLRGAETQSTIQNASAEKYANFAFPLPSVQLQLATIGRLDGQLAVMRQLVEHVTEHIALLREYRSSLISAAVTGQLDISAFKAA